MDKQKKKNKKQIVEELKGETFNSIIIAGVEVASSRESLKHCERVATRLVKKHGAFLVNRSNAKLLGGYIG